MRDRLIELLQKKTCLNNACKEHCTECRNFPLTDDEVERLADHLLANGVSVSPIPKTYESLVHGASFAFGGKCGENFVFGKSIEKGK